jgi:hypothetical protein
MRRVFTWVGLAMTSVVLVYFGSYRPGNSLVRSGVLSARRVDAFYSLIPGKIRYDFILSMWTKIDTRQGVGDRD